MITPSLERRVSILRSTLHDFQPGQSAQARLRCSDADLAKSRAVLQATIDFHLAIQRGESPRWERSAADPQIRESDLAAALTPEAQLPDNHPAPPPDDDWWPHENT